jgi:hypothetical protein
MGKESVFETLENFHTLTRLSAGEDFIENWYVCTNFIKFGKRNFVEISHFRTGARARRVNKVIFANFLHQYDKIPKFFRSM